MTEKTIQKLKDQNTRYKQLLNQIIDHISVARSTPETIEELLTLGFTPEELVNEFGFEKMDVDETIADLQTQED